jgi:hypothetical protein
MLTSSDIETIKNELTIMQAHKEAMEKGMTRILGILDKKQEPKKTGLGEKAIAEREARMFKKTA